MLVKLKYSLLSLHKTSLHCVSKNNTDITHYNFNAHEPISLIFGTDIAEWARYP